MIRNLNNDIEALNAAREKAYGYGSLCSIRDLFDRVRRCYAGRDCIVERDGDAFLVHRTDELCADVEALGTALLAKDLRGAHIGVIGENSYAFLVVLLATVCIGSVAVPLDKELTASDHAALLERADASVVFSAKKYISNLFFRSGLEVFSLSRSEDETDSLGTLIKRGRALLDEGDTSFRDIRVQSHDPAVIIFTSGTTGANKGVVLTHLNLTANAEGLLARLPRVERAMCVLPMNHIYELGCGALPFLYSGTLYCINDRLRHFFENMREFCPGHVTVVPSFIDSIYNSVVTSLRKAGIFDEVFSRIRESNALRLRGIDRRSEIFADVQELFDCPFPHLGCGGAPVNAEHVRFLNDVGFDIYIGYGLSETSPIAAMNTDAFRNNVSVGVPFAQTQIRIDSPDADGNGEIWIRGVNVTGGYYKDPDADAVSFEDGWFKTGDYGRIGAEGELYITGRKKNLIILDNGKNVFPEEIELFFCENCELCSEAVVLETRAGTGGKSVLAAVISIDEALYNTETAAETEKQISALNRKLPSYKRVKDILVVGHPLPKNSTKKILRPLVAEEYERSKEQNAAQ